MKADYVHKDTRTIVVDGVEIQTSLTAVEIASLQQENQRLKEIEKENQELKDRIKTYEEPEDLTLMFMYCDEKAKDKIKELKDRIDKIVEIIEKEIESLKDKKRMIMQILTPENGYLKTDVEYEIKRLERYLEILKGDKE